MKLHKYKYCQIEHTAFKYVKILWDKLDDLVREINSLQAKEIISIKSDIADETTTKNCSGIYYEYFC